MDASVGIGVLAALYILGLVLVIAWVVLPFALIGTKPLLRQLLAEQRRTNALLEAQGIQGRATESGGDGR